MSITITTDVFCDRCPAWINGTTGPRPDAPEARRQARRFGWVRRGGGAPSDLCPECAEATA